MSNIPIFTIGYGARTIAQFLHSLQAHDIAYLIDVRSRPYSRYKPDFSSQPLAAHLQSCQIRYLFLGQQLGGKPSDPACYDGAGNVDYAKLAARADYQEGIGRLVNAWQQQLRVAIMCAEGKPENCHRTHLVAQSLLAAGVSVMHIDEQNQLVSQEAVLARQAATAKPDKLRPTLEGARAVLQRVFGFDSFRPLQAEIISNLLQKQDTLAVMPTGSGKSLCYQLPALLFPGLTVVVSPLISLMEDQVAQLQQVGITAVSLNSSLGSSAYQHTIDDIRTGQVKLLYVAPETLLRPQIQTLLADCQVDCLTIDEAHCISEWGHDFRPEYRQLQQVRAQLQTAVCLCVTATATIRVRQDIKTSLDIGQGSEFIASFDRPNLHLAVTPKTDTFAQTVQFLQQHPEQSGIVYCATRKQVDSLSAQLRDAGFSALPYHAGLDDGARFHNQRQFTHDEVPIIVATVAFGMGINKSNVRFILHVDLPKNLETYYQQIGRAGRDGLRANCLLLFSYGDVQNINYFIQQSHPEQQPGARVRLDAMLQFAESTQCRRRPLLSYFDEEPARSQCNFCDVCEEESRPEDDLTEPAQKFLSCVVRTGQIFGTNHIIDVLRGSKSRKVLQRNHDQLSTYNIGTEFSKKAWRQLARQFIQHGLLRQGTQYGSLKLTRKGRAVMQGEQFLGRLPAQETAVRQKYQAQLADYDQTLFALLKEKRRTLASAGGVPPYVIFSDRTLVEMASFYPQSRPALRRIYGVGEAKLESYAGDFLPILQAYCSEHSIAEKVKAVTPSPKKRSGKRTAEVVALLNSGQPINEIAQQLGIRPRTVLDHLWRAVQAGTHLEATQIAALVTLPEAAQTAVFAAFAEHGTTYLRPIYDALNEQISYDNLHLLRLLYLSKKRR